MPPPLLSFMPMSDLAWRAATTGDAAHLAGLFWAIALTAPMGLETDLAEIQARLPRPGLDLNSDTRGSSAYG
jgi:hypothetical protein